MNEEFDNIEKKLWEQLGKIETPEPTPELKTRFYAMLDTMKEQEAEKKASLGTQLIERLKTLFTYKPTYNWAYAIMMILMSGGIGYFVGKPNNEQIASIDKVAELSNEVHEMKQMMMLNLLENPMATERMKAVSYTEELPSVNDQVIDALLMTLNNDENENVRIVTVEALVKLASYPKVREGLVQSITKQDSPLVQVALADAMVKLQEKKSINQMKKLLQKENLNNTVKVKVEESIKTLI